MKFRFCILLFLPFLLFADEYICSLGVLGNVRYIHEGNLLHQIDRLLPTGEVLYSHSYKYDDQNRLIAENLIGDLGQIIYENPTTTKSPYHQEICEYDSRQNLIRHTFDDTVTEYSYTPTNELITEEQSILCEYDSTGNLIRKGDTQYTYDEHKLISVSTPEKEVTYTYDESGKRISKTVNGKHEEYLYIGLNEFAIIEDGNLTQLRIPGMSAHPDILRPIAIETPTAIYAPIHDIQGNIAKLINIFTREVTTLTRPDPFGNNLSPDALTPWIFSYKHYDQDTNLVYFYHRHYAPDIRQWLTPDPANQTPHNLYQYCSHNPFSFWDPDGRFFSATLVNMSIGVATAVTFPFWGSSAIAVAAGVALGYVAYEGVHLANSWIDSRLLELENIEKRSKTGSFDPTLPSNPDELLNRPGWKETSHPQEEANGRRTFVNPQTGEKLEFDKGRPGLTGHKAFDHYHRPNPNKTGDEDEYLDAKGNPVRDGHDKAHIYPKGER